MDYNTSRNKLVIPEYGRNVQKMVEYAKSIEDRDKRTESAKYIVKVMGNLNSQAGTYGDYNQKIWDHFYIIANFDLDVDSPYPMPDQDKIAAKPKPMEYADDNLKFRTYGRNLQGIIDKAIEFEEGEEKQALIKLIAYNLKKTYLTWNRTSVDDDHIKDDLVRMSGGKLSVPEDFVFPSTQEIIGNKKHKDSQQKSYQSKSTNKYKSKTGRHDNSRSGGTSGRSNYSTNKRRTN